MKETKKKAAKKKDDSYLAWAWEIEVKPGKWELCDWTHVLKLKRRCGPPPTYDAKSRLVRVKVSRVKRK
jgi:hypothetical protein